MRQRLTVGGAVLARGAAMFLAGFSLIGLVGEARGGATDIALWFVDIRDLRGPLEILLLAALSITLLAWVLADRVGRWRRRAAALSCLVFAGFAVRDVVRYAGNVGGGLVRPTTIVPLSLVIAVVLGAMAVGIWRDRGLAGLAPRRIRLAVVVAATGWVAVFPVAQIAFFGTTDYRRPADAAVVFGARVYASGVPSPLLADRIATGVDLYRSGLVPVLVMSGGDGADGYNEAAVMRDQAIAAGVDPAAIVVDASGVTTDATVDHVIGLLAAAHGGHVPQRLIAVSQAYHLPRIQLAFSRAGIDVLTVPAVDPIPIVEMPLLIAREIPAFWTYYLRACLG